LNKELTPPLAALRGLGMKVGIIIVAGLVLLIPLQLVLDVIRERGERAEEVTKEIAGKWSGPQTLRGPFLLLPADRINSSLPNAAPQQRIFVLLPDDFAAEAEVAAETRSRGIFDAEIYTARLRLSGSFSEASLDRTPLGDDWRLRPDLAVLVLGLGDLRGLQEDVSLDWDGKSVAAQSGVPAGALNLEGLHWPVGAFAGKGDSVFEVEMTLRGSTALSVMPVGKQNLLRIAGNWPAPSFDGIALPQSQELDDSGFKAQWRVSHFSRALPQSWGSYAPPAPSWQETMVGVKFLDPVDFYRLSERSVKYGALFIALTFLVLFLFEVLLGVAIHPVQYLLVGAALVLFFLNLVALAEVAGFAAAYGLSALIVSAMISLYAAAILKRRLWAGLLFSVTAALYGLLFLVLRMEEAALLSGSLVLLAALALTMYATRNIDWAGFAKPPAPPPGRAGGEAEDARA
jgi:inner membrane protein